MCLPLETPACKLKFTDGKQFWGIKTELYWISNALQQGFFFLISGEVVLIV